MSDRERIILSLKEIYRLLTWGPSGKGWIAEVEIPPEIYKAGRILLDKLQYTYSDIFEKEPWLKELKLLLNQQ